MNGDGGMIVFEKVSRRYGARAVVEDVSLTVPAGSLTAIVGTSGAGKSTLLRMVNRLVEPSEGRILLEGRDIADEPAYRLRRSIGYAIQHHGLFPHWNVARNIATVPELLGWSRAEQEARVAELLEMFGLDPARFSGRYPHELSGGEQQRVGVARALAARPAVLLMDEPFGALDPVLRARAQADLAAIRARTGTTILLVTHDMSEAMRLADQLAVMQGGRLLHCAPPAEILARPAHPFVAALVGAAERPFHYLALSRLGEAAEPGAAEGAALAAGLSLNEALAELLWSGREAAPVAGPEGEVIGRVTRAELIRRAARPAA